MRKRLSKYCTILTESASKSSLIEKKMLLELYVDHRSEGAST